MTIQLNGSLHEIDKAVTIAGLLASIGFAGRPVIVEINEQAVFPRDYEAVMIEDGARVEVVALAAGG